MRTVVIYKSKTGYTKKYALWLKEELNADIFEQKDVKINDLEKYDNIIYGGGLYAIGINGLNFITKNITKLKNKKIVVFATGVSPLRENTVPEVVNNNFTIDQQKLIKFYYLRGGFYYKGLPLFERILMKILKWKILFKKKSGKKLIPDEIGMLTVFDKYTDYTKKEYINEIIEYIGK